MQDRAVNKNSRGRAGGAASGCPWEGYRGVAIQSSSAAGSHRTWRFALGRLSQEQIVAALTVVLLLVFGLGLQGFATTANLLGLVRGISILGILGLGMGLIVI